MRRICVLMAFVAVVCTMDAQTLNVQVGDVTYAFPAAQTGDMIYVDGTQLTVMGKTFPVDDITLMYVDDYAVTDNTVDVTYNGDGAKVVVAGNVARYVEPIVSGAHVSITQSTEVSETTCGEIIYGLAGESTDGSFGMTGTYKATVELHGLTLTNPSGAPIDIQNGKRIDLSLKSGTTNTLTDGATGSQKGCIACTGHLELKGKGTLNVYGNAAHAIYAKEYIEMKNCTLNVLSAVKDGLNCNQYFLMESGVLDITAVGDDGLQVSYKDETNREAEDTGSITIVDGSINMAVTATAAKGMKADGDVSISGGTINITTTGGGEWDSEDLKTKASTCVSADGNISISGGTLTLESTGSGGKAVSCDGALTIDGGDITAKTSGGLFAYVNGREYDNYTGNTDRLDSDYTLSPKGMKADGDITINGGTISVTTSGNNAEGIESKSLMTIAGGTVVVNSYDDGLNSASHMYLKGGDITVIATNNDAIDSNGNMYISGGIIRAFGASAPEGGIDANEEEGYTVVFTGGALLAVGGNNSVPSTSESTQPYVSGAASLTAGSTVSLKQSSTEFATFAVPDNYTSSGGGNMRPGMGGGFPGGGSGGSVLISCEGLTAGSSYTLTCGSSSTTVTARTR